MQKMSEFDWLLGCVFPRGQDPVGLEEWDCDPQVLQRVGKFGAFSTTVSYVATDFAERDSIVVICRRPGVVGA